MSELRAKQLTLDEVPETQCRLSGPILCNHQGSAKKYLFRKDAEAQNMSASCESKIFDAKPIQTSTKTFRSNSFGKEDLAMMAMLVTLPLLNAEQFGDSRCSVASSIFGRRISTAIFLVVAMCGTQGWASEKRFTYKEPFSLRERGIGANPIEGQLMLDARDEEPVVSRVLLQTIQGFHLSIPERPPDAAEPLQPKHDYKTDMAPLSDEEVRKYNASETGKLVLDGTLEYALQYVVSYEIHVERDRYFFIEMKPKLYFKGAASSEWREYKRDYSGDYFASALMDALKSNFKTAAQSMQSPH